jgi:extracellular solute-binding protein (family 3)
MCSRLPANDVWRPVLSGAGQPMMSTDSRGQASGPVADLLPVVAAKEGWRAEYVPCAWAQCLKNLAAGEIDPLGAIAPSDERAQRFDFGRPDLRRQLGHGLCPTGRRYPVYPYLADARWLHWVVGVFAADRAVHLLCGVAEQ